MHPPIKYVGSKRKLLPKISEYIPTDTTVIFEPFCGSAALSFSKDMPFYISDASPELINFYHVLQHDFDRLIFVLAQIEADQTKGLYYELRALDRLPDFENTVCRIKMAARYYYIIFGGFNGLYRVNKKNQCNTPIGDKCMKVNYVLLEEARDYLVKFSRGVHHKQFDDLGILISVIGAGSTPFVLIDPPYAETFCGYTPEGDSGDFYDRLDVYLDSLDKSNVPFLMTNTYCDFILDRFSRFYIEKVETKYSIAADGTKRGQKFEAFISNK